MNLSYDIRLIILSLLFIFILTGCELSSKDEIQEVEENVVLLINNEEVYLEEFEGERAINGGRRCQENIWTQQN